MDTKCQEKEKKKEKRKSHNLSKHHALGLPQ
jgi:hypothetical protein